MIKKRRERGGERGGEKGGEKGQQKCYNNITEMTETLPDKLV